jgi:hypothetical protein
MTMAREVEANASARARANTVFLSMFDPMDEVFIGSFSANLCLRIKISSDPGYYSSVLRYNNIRGW